MKHRGGLLEKILGFLCAVVLGAMLLVVSTQVVMRYALHLPFTWGEELARYLQIWLTFLGTSFAFVVGGHASIQMLLVRLPKKIQWVVRVLIASFVGAFFLVLVTKGLSLVRFTWSDESPALSLPFGIVYLALPVGSGLIFLIQIRDLWRLFRPESSRESETG